MIYPSMYYITFSSYWCPHCLEHRSENETVKVPHSVARICIVCSEPVEGVGKGSVELRLDDEREGEY